jgi:FAD/FMN-containing dehydrogenase
MATPDDAEQLHPGGADRLSAAISGSSFQGTTIFETLPRDRWAGLARPTATDSISRRIRSAFDPHSLLNPGILGDGA